MLRCFIKLGYPSSFSTFFLGVSHDYCIVADNGQPSNTNYHIASFLLYWLKNIYFSLSLSLILMPSDSNRSCVPIRLLRQNHFNLYLCSSMLTFPCQFYSPVCMIFDQQCSIDRSPFSYILFSQSMLNKSC